MGSVKGWYTQGCGFGVWGLGFRVLRTQLKGIRYANLALAFWHFNMHEQNVKWAKGNSSKGVVLGTYTGEKLWSYEGENWEF